MKKILAFSLALASLGIGRAADIVINIEGVDIIQDFYSSKISLDGTQIVGVSEDGSTIYYNSVTEEAYIYPDCTYGRGYVVADNGWVVGCRLLDSNDQTNEGVVMSEGEIMTPPVLKPYVTSNIHSITPDASRICGVVANNGRGMSNLPYYCDIDENGNFGELKFLPCPEKDFFGNTPQYVSATWISEDGHTIAGQVIENRGFFVYPIVFTENEQGIWSYSLPSESLFNTDHLEVPEPLGDFDEEYPDLKSTEITDYMDPSKLADWNAAMLQWEINNFADSYDPYNNLEKFMTEEQIEEYIEAVNAYNEAVEIYNQDNFAYWEKVFAIVDCSAFFVRNGMALSPDGRWLASSAEWEDTSSTLYDEPMMYYVPYQFNLTTGEIKKVDSNTSNVNTVQVFNNGDVISVSPAALAMPPRSWIYLNDRGESLNIADYVKEVSPFYGAWYEENLTGDIPVAEDENGYLIYEHATVTGHVAMSEDQSVLVGGVQGYSIGLDMYLSYIFNDMYMAGVEKIADETNFDGTYHVYNLQGVKVLTTKDTSLLKSLPHGIYVINGKKIIK